MSTSALGEDDNADDARLDQEGGERLSPKEPDAESQHGIDQESIEEMDNIVNSFRHDEIMKLKALSKILSILNVNQSRTERSKNAAVEYYTKTLDEIQALSSSAAWRGELVRDTLGSG